MSNSKVQNIQKRMSHIKPTYGGCTNVPKAENIPPNTASHATFNENCCHMGGRHVIVIGGATGAIKSHHYIEKVSKLYLLAIIED